MELLSELVGECLHDLFCSIITIKLQESGDENGRRGGSPVETPFDEVRYLNWLLHFYVFTFILLFWMRLEIVIIAGMLLLPMLLAAFFWKLKGAVVSAVLNSSLFVLAYLVFKPLSFPMLLVAVTSYLIVGLVRGLTWSWFSSWLWP